MEIVPVYDRSQLILAAIATLKEKLIEISAVVGLVSLLFLFHLRSALVAILTLPIAILLSFLSMYYLGVTSNIMSLAGIAIAIGAMVDAVIVMIENAHKRLEEWDRSGYGEERVHREKEPVSAGTGRAGEHGTGSVSALPGRGGREGCLGRVGKTPASRMAVIIRAAQEVGKPLFFSLLIITVSFLPIFTLEAQEGRLFKPLAYTKTAAMFCGGCVDQRRPLADGLAAERQDPAARKQSSESMAASTLSTDCLGGVAHPMAGGDSCGARRCPDHSLLWTPRLGIHAAAQRRLDPLYADGLARHLDWRGCAGAPATGSTHQAVPRGGACLREGRPCPNVDRPGPPQHDGDRHHAETGGPVAARRDVGFVDQRMDESLHFPGMANIWWMPIQTRTEMLATGIRSHIGIKVLGSDLSEIERIGLQLESLLQRVRGTRNAYAERVTGGYYLDFRINREEAARYGLTVGDVEDVIESAIGGKTISQTIEGRERYPINVRYARSLREDIEALRRVLVETPSGAQVPMAQLADIKMLTGPPSVRDEQGSLAGIVFLDVAGRDLGGYVAEAKRLIADKIQLKPGYRVEWGGQFQYLERAKARLNIVVPMTVLVIFVLLYLNFRSIARSLIVLLSVPFAAVGAVLFLYLLGYHLSVAVWVGIIALAGVAAETGVVMIIFLDEACDRRQREGRLHSMAHLHDAIIEGAVQRVRPKIMTASAVLIGLLPIMWSHGTGADVMKRIAAPMIGGMVSSTILTLIVIPVLYFFWRRVQLRDAVANPLESSIGEKVAVESHERG
jgi:Cu(I)/Ag(I) efflux system membrane protein CusA/SilA